MVGSPALGQKPIFVPMAMVGIEVSWEKILERRDSMGAIRLYKVGFDIKNNILKVDNNLLAFCLPFFSSISIVNSPRALPLMQINSWL